MILANEALKSTNIINILLISPFLRIIDLKIDRTDEVKELKEKIKQRVEDFETGEMKRQQTQSLLQNNIKSLEKLHFETKQKERLLIIKEQLLNHRPKSSLFDFILIPLIETTKENIYRF